MPIFNQHLLSDIIFGINEREAWIINKGVLKRGKKMSKRVIKLGRMRIRKEWGGLLV